MSKALYLSLPESIREHLVLGDKLRYEMGLDTFEYKPSEESRRIRRKALAYHRKYFGA